MYCVVETYCGAVEAAYGPYSDASKAIDACAAMPKRYPASNAIWQVKRLIDPGDADVHTL